MQITQTQPVSNAVRNSKLQKFFIDQLKDIYYAEQKLVKTLPKLEEASNSNQLKVAFHSHLEETKNHVSRLEKIFDLVGETAETRKCRAIVGIIDEGEDIIGETEENTAQRDVGLIFAGQKAEHYEIATYGGLVQVARTLGYADVAELLGVTLAEEKNANDTLTRIAVDGMNIQASQEMYEN